MRRLLPLALLMVLPLAAGCLSGGTSEFRFEAEGPEGSARGEGTCDDRGRLVGEVTGAAGTVKARVLDGAGNALLDKALPPGPVEMDLRGEPGTWTMSVASDKLDGRFWFRLRCG